jgi:hypothetical protein
MLLATAMATLGFATAANAATSWTNWTSGTVGTGSSGSASGALGGVGVSYSGEMECLNCYASNWSPAATWEGGPVTDAPPDNSGVQLFGGSYGGATDTITFSSPVTDPVIAIVSLGQNGIQAQFDFTTSAFSLAGGGPSSTWGGQALTRVGDIVYGEEGNGLVLFHGTYSSISWTNPVQEGYYAFTVGSAVPEPSTWAMMGFGFAGLAFAGFRSRRTATAIA